jgi:glucose-6-phosphate isomerase
MTFNQSIRVFLDYSKNIITSSTMPNLLELANEYVVDVWRKQIFQG